MYLSNLATFVPRFLTGRTLAEFPGRANCYLANPGAAG